MAVRFVPINQKFDPEGSGYDYFNAYESGDARDETDHLGSVDPRTGMMLKGRKHESWDKAVATEEARGNKIIKRPDGRYYSVPANQYKGIRFVPLERPMSRKELSAFGVSQATNQNQRKAITNRLQRMYSTLGYSELGGQVSPESKDLKDVAKDIGRGLVISGPKALARGTEQAIGTAGTLAQWAWEKASIGDITTRHIDIPGAGLIAEHLVRKYGPKKALELADKKMKEHAETGKKWADWWEEQAQKGWEAPNPELMKARWDRPFEYGAAVTMESAPSFVTAIGAGYLTKNPNISLAMLGMFEKMNAYRTQRKAGASVRKADIISTLSGAWEAVTEKVPFDFILKGKTKSLLTKALLSGSLESLQELLAGMGQNYLEYFGYKAKDWKSIPAAHKEGLEHAMDQWQENVVAGGALGILGGGAVDIANARELQDIGRKLGIPVGGLTAEAAADKINEVLEARRPLLRSEQPALQEAELPITRDEREQLRDMGLTIEEIGRTPATDLRRMLKEGGIADKETLEREGEIRAVSKSDPRLARILAKNLYSGAVDKIIVKELIQNAHDAIIPMVDPTAKNVEMGINTNKRLIRIEDDGEGMTPEVMQNQFVDKGGSYKKGPSAGGFGIAKFAIFGHAAHITAVSTAKVGDKYVTTSLQGTGDDWIDETRGLKVDTREGVFDKTGTTVEIELLPFEQGGIEQFDGSSIFGYLTDFSTYSQVPYNYKFTVDGHETTPKPSWPVKKLPARIKGKGFTADVYASDNITPSSTNWHHFHVLNRGIYQFTRGFDVPDVRLPEVIVIDVQSDLSPDADNYPFDASREKLKEDTERAIRQYISDNITGELLKETQEAYKTAFNNAVKIEGTHSRLVDSSNQMDPKKVQGWANAPVYQNLAKQMKIIFNDMMRALSNYLPGEVRLHGFVLARDYVGIHVKGSYLNTPKNQIMINAAGLWAEIETDPQSFPDVFAGRIVATLLHEIAHQKAGYHMEGYAKALTQIIAKTIKETGKGARSLSRVLKGENYEWLDNFFKEQYAESIRKDLFGPLASGESIAVPAEGEGKGLAGTGEEARAGRGKAESAGLEPKAGTKANAEQKKALKSLGLSDQDIKTTPTAELNDKIDNMDSVRRRMGGFLGIPVDTPAPKALRAGLESWYQDYVNRFASIENLDKKARKLGMVVLPGQLAGHRARLYLGLGMQVKAVLERGTVRYLPDGTHVITGEGLKPIVDDLENTLPLGHKHRKEYRSDWVKYVQARRIVEDLQRPPYEGSTRDIATPEQVRQAKKDLADIKKKYNQNEQGQMENIAQRFYGYQKRVLRMLVDSGQLSQKQYQKIIADNPHYVSFERIFEKTGLFAGLPRAIFTKARVPFRKIKGTEKQLAIQDPIEMAIKNTYRIMEAASRNTVARNVAQYMNILPEEIRPVSVKMYPIKVDPEEIQTEVKRFRSSASEVTREARRIRREGGEGADITGPAARLEQVVKEALTHRGFSEGEANSFINQIKKGRPTEGDTHTVEEIDRVVRETVNIIKTEVPLETTIFRPSQFMPRGQVIEYFENGKRRYMEVSDNLYKAMTGMNEEGANIITKILSKPAGWLRIGATITPEFMTRNPMRDTFTAFMQTAFGFVPFIDPMRAIADVVGRTDIYYDWLRSGGAYSGFVELSRPALRKAYKELTSSRGRTLLKHLNPIVTAEELSQLMEQATRLAIYKNYLRKGLTPVEAGFASREGTVDFARRGARMGGVAKSVAFLNAGIQGFDKTVRHTITHPFATAIKGAMAITLPSLLLAARNLDDPEYKEIPQWQKDLFWLIKLDDTWYRVPKPFVYGQMFGTIPERFFEYWKTGDPESFDGFVNSIIKSSSPVGINPIEALIPTAVKPIIENMTNYSFFRERDVVPKSVSELAAPEQYSRYTTEAAKYLGKWLNYSPSKIENLFYGYTGGTGRYVLEGTDVLIRAIKGEERKGRPRELSDYPLVRGFVPRPPIGPSAESITDFYELSEPIIANRRSYTDAVNRGNNKKADEIRRKHPEIWMAPDLIKYQTQMSEINRIIDRIAESDLPVEQKRDLIKNRDQQRVDIARRANEIIKRNAKPQEKEIRFQPASR